MTIHGLNLKKKKKIANGGIDRKGKHFLFSIGMF